MSKEVKPKFEEITFIELSEKTYDELSSKLNKNFKFTKAGAEEYFSTHLIFLTLTGAKFGVFRKQDNAI